MVTVIPNTTFMTNLNDGLYKRFGLELQVGKVQGGFLHFINNLIDDKLGPIRHPDGYQDRDQLYKIQRSVLTDSCRQMFLDANEYEDWDYGFGWFLKEVFDTNFSEVLIRLQILINLIYTKSFIKYELDQFIDEISQYLQDYPILGLTLVKYKTRAPQFLPSTSKVFEKEIKDTLGLLESSTVYKQALDNYEDGLREFLTATSQAQLKDVVEDIYTSCDTVIQAAVGIQKSGLRSLFVGKTSINIGFNKWQLKIFDEMRDWMDKIKHGAEKGFTKKDVEMLVLLVSSFIKLTINNKGPKK